MKKNILFTLLIIAGVSYIFNLNNTNNKVSSIKSDEDKSKQRAPSSNSPIIFKEKQDKRKVVTTKEDIKLKQRLLENLNLKDQVLEIEKVGSKRLERLSSTILFSHYKVRIKSNQNHMQSSYDALIDPDTGKIVKTWNKPHIEYPKKITFSIEGRAYNP